MDKKRLILIAGLLVAAMVIFTQVKKLSTPAPVSAPVPETVVETVEYLDVLIAADNLPFGTKVNATSLQWKAWPVEAMGESFITSDARPDAMEELIGTVVRTDIYAGEPVSERKLIQAGDQGVMAALLRPGMRAVTTRISVDTAAGGFIQPGDRVDIILTHELPQQQSTNFDFNERRSVSETIFQNVHVLAIDQTFTTIEEGGAAVVGSTATFEMTQGDAEILQEADAKGDLTLTLRGINDARSASGKSAAVTKRKQTGSVSTITVYRQGQPEFVAIKGN